MQLSDDGFSVESLALDSPRGQLALKGEYLPARHFRMDLAGTLAGIQARAAVVACDHDLYFTVDDMAADAAAIPGAALEVLHSTLGHRAGNPHSSPAEQQHLRRIVDQLLDS